MNPKAQSSLHVMIEAITALYAANPSDASVVMADATRTAKRLINRANTPEGMERFELIQTRGPTVEFSGRMIHNDSYVSRSGNEHEIELYQTSAGNLVVNEITQSVGGDEINRLTAADAGDYLAIMDALNWEQMARTMARKLKWPVKVEIE